MLAFPRPIFHMSNEDEPGHNKVSLDNLMEENVSLALWKIWLEQFCCSHKECGSSK